MPFISIVIPVYNVEKALAYCIDSVLNQTYCDFELILVDDGSTDGSGGICDEYVRKDSRVRVIHKSNGGVSSARNIGIANSKGDCICFIDSDDSIDPDYLAELAEKKFEYPDCDNIWCGFQTVNGYESYEVIRKVVYSDTEEISFLSAERIMDLHQKWLSPGPVCKLYSKEVIIENDIRFDESLSLGEDLIFNFQYLDRTNKKIAVINRCLYNYVYIEDSSLSKKHYPDMFEIYKRINDVMLKYLNKWECGEDQFKLYYNSCFHRYEAALRNTFHKDSTVDHKYKYNRSIMRSQEFKTAFENATCFIHPLYKYAYEHSFAAMLRLMDHVALKR